MKRVLALLLSVCMIVTFIPMISFAADTDQTQNDGAVVTLEPQEEDVVDPDSEGVPKAETPAVGAEAASAPDGVVEELPDQSGEEEAVSAMEVHSGTWKSTPDGWMFYTSETGYLDNGRYEVLTSNSYYYFDANGIMQTGLQTYYGYKYYYSKAAGTPGKSKYGKELNGWIDAEGKGYCYFSTKSDVMLFGWQKINNKKYYLDNTTGVRKTGWQTIDGYKYHFASNGEMHVGWKTLDGKMYYFAKSGVMVTGWQNIDGYRYHFDSNGVRQTGWQTIDGKRYCFSKSGVMLTGWQKLDGYKYYFASNGVMQTGWQKIDGYWYYFSTSTGHMLTGWQTLKGNKFYFSTSTGHMLTGWQKLLDWKTKTAKKWYYFIPSTGRMARGWTTISGKKYYFNKSTGVVTTGWANIDGSRYYFKSSGAMATGWLTLSKKTYYLDPSTGKMKKSWQTIKGKTYFFNTSTGVMAKGWLKYNGKKYYMNTDTGVMTKGLKTISGVVYFFKDNGAMKTNGCQKVSGKLYYFYKSGKSQTSKGWFEGSDGKTRYCKGNGVVASGQSKVGSTWYLFDSNTGVKIKKIGDDIDKKVQSKSSGTSYLLVVNRAKYHVRVYTGSKNNWSRTKKFDCAIGKSSTPTQTGTFTISKKGLTNQYKVDGVVTRYYYYVYYTGKQGIHSGLYYDGTGNPGTPYDTRLNVKSTNGGVRVSLNNAKWIYEYVPVNTTVVVY